MRNFTEKSNTSTNPDERFLEAEEFNELANELESFISDSDGGNLTLSSGDLTQLKKSSIAMINRAITLFSTTYGWGGLNMPSYGANLNLYKNVGVYKVESTVSNKPTDLTTDAICLVLRADNEAQSMYQVLFSLTTDSEKQNRIYVRKSDGNTGTLDTAPANFNDWIQLVNLLDLQALIDVAGNAAIFYCGDEEGATPNEFTITPTGDAEFPNPLTAGTTAIFQIKDQTTGTLPITLNVGGTSYSLKHSGTSDIVYGDRFKNNSYLTVVYDGTDWNLLDSLDIPLNYYNIPMPVKGTVTSIQINGKGIVQDSTNRLDYYIDRDITLNVNQLASASGASIHTLGGRADGVAYAANTAYYLYAYGSRTGSVLTNGYTLHTSHTLTQVTLNSVQYSAKLLPFVVYTDYELEGILDFKILEGWNTESPKISLDNANYTDIDLDVLEDINNKTKANIVLRLPNKPRLSNYLSRKEREKATFQSYNTAHRGWMISFLNGRIYAQGAEDSHGRWGGAVNINGDDQKVKPFRLLFFNSTNRPVTNLPFNRNQEGDYIVNVQGTGFFHNFIKTKSGQLYTTGNGWLQAVNGQGTNTQIYVPTVLRIGTDLENFAIDKLNASSDTSGNIDTIVIATTTNGNAWVWGNPNGNGDFIGSGSTPTHLDVPTQITDANFTGKTVKKIACTAVSAAVLFTDGTLISIGNNVEGWQNTSNTTLQSSWQTVTTGVEDFTIGKTVTPTGQYTLYIVRSSDGSIETCGYGANGSLGNGGTANINTLADTGVDLTLSNKNSRLFVVSHQAGYNVFAITSDSEIYSWGHNLHGSLGLGDTTVRTSPTRNTNLETLVVTHGSIIQIVGGRGNSSGTKNTFVLFEDGAVYTMGYNGEGALGTLSTNNSQQSTPLRVLFSEPIIDIVNNPIAGTEGCLAIGQETGLVYASGGDNDSSQVLGRPVDGNTGNVSYYSPQSIDFFDNNYINSNW